MVEKRQTQDVWLSKSCCVFGVVPLRCVCAFSLASADLFRGFLLPLMMANAGLQIWVSE